MKFKFIHALAVVAAMSAFTSCSDDEKVIAPGSLLEEKTYSDDELTINLDGTPLYGKVVSFVPGTEGKATITLSGAPLNVMDIIGNIDFSRADDAMVLPTIPTAGVLPGSPTLTIPVTLEGDGDNCTFSGTGESDYCTYSFSGSASADNFEMNLTNVELKNQSLAGTWNLPEFLRDPEDETSGYLFNIARIEWKSEKGAAIELFPGFAMEMPVRDVLVMALGMPLFDPDNSGKPHSSVLNMLSTTLKTVTLGKNGDVTASYIDAKTGKLTNAPAGLAQYVISSNGTLRLFLNPEAIIANTLGNSKAASRAADISAVIEGLLTQLIPMFTEGIPVKYGPAIIDDQGGLSEDLTSFYLDTNTLLPILKAVAPLMSDEEFVNNIISMIASDPSMAAMAGSLSGVLKSFPDIVSTTSKIEIGINLKK